MLIQSTERRKAPLNKAVPPVGTPDRRKTPAPDSVSLGDPMAGNKVTSLLGGDQIFPEAESRIRGAQSTVQLQMYRLGYDKMVQALADTAWAARSRCRYCWTPRPGYDAAGAASQAKIQKFLTDAGVEILKYPVKHSGMIDHVKLLIVDGKSAIIGGMNWDQHSHQNLERGRPHRGSRGAGAGKGHERRLEVCPAANPSPVRRRGLRPLPLSETTKCGS